MIFANVIFPAFEAAYVSWAFLLPLAVVVLVLEGVILWAFNREAKVAAVIPSPS